MKNKSMFNMLETGNIRNIPVSDTESVILRTLIQQEIRYRLINEIDTDNSEYIICLRNTLENLY